jgi:hypothetical protein
MDRNKIKHMKKATQLCHRILPALIFMVSPALAFSQTLLEANGPGNTYELINSVLAPTGGDVVENPECIHPEFGRHIAEVWDTDLSQYVFEFYIHVTPDNDRCINFDRQRVEIKTYDASPDNLKGVSGETVIYKWRFKVPAGFQPSSSFTHIHQVKAVGGDEADPLFTLTARKGSPNKLELNYYESSSLSSVKFTSANLSLFENTWVEATERIKIDNLNGTYSITIKKVSDGTTVLSYSNSKLLTIRSDNSFIRPKWGIYRSLLNSQDLRDESLRFNSFSITEEAITSLVSQNLTNDTGFKAVSTSSFINVEYDLPKEESVQLSIFNINGQLIKTLIQLQHQERGKHQHQYDVSTMKKGIYFLRLQTDGNQRTIKLIL